MRSSPSAPESPGDPLDPGPAGFAHRGLHGPTVPENSLAAASAAIAIGAGIEVDLRLSRDGVPFVFHDRDARRMTGDPIMLSSAPAAVIAELPLWGIQETIPRLTDLLALVAGKVPLLLEIKEERNAARFGPALATALADYPGAVGVMSFSSAMGTWLRRKAPKIRRGLVMKGGEARLARWYDMRAVDPHFIAINVRHLGSDWAEEVRGRMPLYAWTVNSPVARELAEEFADAAIWEADGRP